MNNPDIVKYNGNISKCDYEAIKEIYEESFPEKERTGSIDDLINSAKEDKRFELELFYADPDEKGTKQLVAFSYSLNEKDFFYGIFIAIKKEFRSKGYGKIFLNHHKEVRAINKHFFLCAEKVEDTAENKEQRIKRSAFFHKLGFKVVETDIDLNGVMFDLYSLKEVTPEEVDHYLDKIQEAILPDYYDQA